MNIIIPRSNSRNHPHPQYICGSNYGNYANSFPSTCFNELSFVSSYLCVVNQQYIADNLLLRHV